MPDATKLGVGVAGGAAGAGAIEKTTGGLTRVADMAGNAFAGGLQTASRQLARIQQRLQSMDVTQAMDGLQEAVRNLGRDGAATMMPVTQDALHHLPEVLV